MSFFPTKILALSVLIALGVVMSSQAHAGILRSSNGVPVLTKDGNCVTTNWEGGEACDSAKSAAGIGDAFPDAVEKDGIEKTLYFGFNSSKLTARAKHHLDHLAKRLGKANKLNHGRSIKIVGFADRIGKASYNEKLAKKRADAVRDYLVSKGVIAKKMDVVSMGKTEPKAECSADLPHGKLIQCLHEDRRVEIQITQ